MIIVDFSQIFLAPIHTDGVLKSAAMNPCEESKNILTHTVLNSLRFNFVKHKPTYGTEMVIACDNSSWRRDYFPNYKYRRRLNRGSDESGIDWKFIGEVQNSIIEDLKNFYPFTVVKYPKAEGDDIIGALVKRVSERVSEDTNIFGDPEVEEILIISSDTDHYQLQTYKNVKQWHPVKKKMVKGDCSADIYLLKKIIGGDGGDDIPNIRMGDNTFVNNDRQKPITEKFCASFITAHKAGREPHEGQPDDIRAGFDRNRTLIDYRRIPKEIYTGIVECYNESTNQRNFNKMKLLNHLSSRGMKELYTKIGDFF